MSIIQSIDMGIDCIIEENKQLLNCLYYQNENIPNDLCLTEKKSYANTLFDKIEEVEQIIDTMELIKKKNLSLKESKFCNIDFDGSQIKLDSENKLVTDDELVAELREEQINKLKIGELVRYIIKRLNRDKKITQIDMSNLQNKEWCEEILFVNYPVIKKYNQYLSHSDQRKENGKLKYYSPIYIIDDGKYLICSELFDRTRQPIMMWFSEKYNVKLDYNNESKSEKIEDNKSIILVKYDMSSLKHIVDKLDRPFKIIIKDQAHEVSNWSETMLKICESMIEFYPDKMIKIVEEPQFRGAKRYVFNSDPLMLVRPKRLSNGVYVQTNFTASKILNICYNIILYCGLNKDNLKIYCYEKKISIIKEDEYFVSDNKLTIEDIDSDFVDEFIRILEVFQD